MSSQPANQNAVRNHELVVMQRNSQINANATSVHRALKELNMSLIDNIHISDEERQQLHKTVDLLDKVIERTDFYGTIEYLSNRNQPQQPQQSNETPEVE